MKHLYISNGHLFLKDGEGDAVEIDSDFGAKVVERGEKLREKNQWKNQTRPEQGMFALNVWNVPEDGNPREQIRIQSAAMGLKDDEVYYILTTEAVGGLFRYDLRERSERRIFHKENFLASDLDHHPREAKLLCAVAQDAVKNIALLSCERFDCDFLTEGDSADESPSWVPGEKSCFVYQSAGIGRNQAGHHVGLGPSSIEKVDLDGKTQKTILSDERYDYLSPKVDNAGNLYCIRRDYEVGGRSASPLEILKDFVLFPFRLLKAAYGFLEMMTQIFAKESLQTSASGMNKEVDMRHAWIKGRLIQLKAYDAKREGESIFPSSWKLIKVSAPSGVGEVLFSGVGDFDISPNGEVLYTTGRSILSARDEGSQRLWKGREIIEEVRVASPGGG